MYDDYKYNDELLSAEKTAKEEKIGVWREKEEKSDPPSKNKKEKGFFDDIISFFSNIFESIVDFFETTGPNAKREVSSLSLKKNLEIRSTFWNQARRIFAEVVSEKSDNRVCR